MKKITNLEITIIVEDDTRPGAYEVNKLTQHDWEQEQAKRINPLIATDFIERIGEEVAKTQIKEA